MRILLWKYHRWLLVSRANAPLPLIVIGRKYLLSFRGVASCGPTVIESRTRRIFNFKQKCLFCTRVIFHFYCARLNKFAAICSTCSILNVRHIRCPWIMKIKPTENSYYYDFEFSYNEPSPFSSSSINQICGEQFEFFLFKATTLNFNSLRLSVEYLHNPEIDPQMGHFPRKTIKIHPIEATKIVRTQFRLSVRLPLSKRTTGSIAKRAAFFP